MVVALSRGYCGLFLPCNNLLSSAEALDSSLHGPSDVDDQHDYDSVASDEDTDQEPLRSANAARNNRARVSSPQKPGVLVEERVASVVVVKIERGLVQVDVRNAN